MINQTWQLQEAKSKFSRVVDRAMHGILQVVTKHGVEAVVVLSYEEYQKLLIPQKGIVDFFRESPLVGAELDLERDKNDWRDELEL